MKKPYYAYPIRFLCVVLCGAVLLLSLWQVTGSQVLGRKPALNQQRGKAWIEQLAKEPHPRGSAAHETVREALLAGLAETGADVVEMVYEVNTQDMRRFGQDDIIYPNTTLTNLLVVVPGTRADAVLATAYYDSTLRGPGASANMSGVANLLLTVEKIRQEGLTFENTLLFLFTDGGEEGHLGAEVFAESRVPLEVRRDGAALSQTESAPYRAKMQDVKLALNLSSWGTGGAVQLVETGEQNLRTMEAFAGANPGIPGSGLSGVFYHLVGQKADYTPFADRKIQGLNFANVGQSYYYHTQHDDVAHLRSHTLARGGDALFQSLTLYGNTSLDTLSKATGDAIFFEYLGLITVAVPRVVGWVLTGVVVLLFIIWAARTSARFSSGTLFRNLFVGLFLLLLGLAAGGCAIWGAGYLLSAAAPSLAARLASPVYMSVTLWGGLCLVGAFAALLVWGGLGKLFSITGRTLRENAVLLLCLLGVVCAFLLPAATYLFLPAGLVGLVLMLLTTFRASDAPVPLGLYALVFAVSAPFLLALSYFALHAIGAPALPFLALPVLLCLAFVLSYVMDIPSRRRILSWLAVCAVLLVLGGGLVGIETARPAASDAAIDLGEHAEGYRAEFDDDRLLVELGEAGGRAILRIRDEDMVRALGKRLWALGFRRGADGWTLEAAVALPDLAAPTLNVRHTGSVNKTSIEVQKAYPDSIFELHIPARGVTQIGYEDALGSGSIGFDPIGTGEAEYRIFQSRRNATVTITAQGEIADIFYYEYLPDAPELAEVSIVQQVQELSPVVRPQLNLWRKITTEDALRIESTQGK